MSRARLVLDGARWFAFVQVDAAIARNLAADPESAADTILQLNALLNRLIDEEVGVDDGRFLPTGTQKPWEVERWDV